ncbi:MAG TPA: NAD-dependent epimerase/dehydratase family protein [Oculatellaceae cyanobacterium]
MTRCLLTGATGFVGANLAHKLLREGHEVNLLVRKEHNPKRLEGWRDSVNVHTVELLDRDATDKLLATLKPEWVFHLAASGAYSWQNDIEQIFQTNVTSLVNLLEAAAKVGFAAFINAGSSSEYGYKDHAPREDELVEPNSYYAVAKASATQFCRFLANSRKLPISTLRLYSAYGPYEDRGRLIPTIIRNGLENKLPPLVDPNIARDYIYVDDVCSAFVKAATKLTKAELSEQGAVFNIGSSVQTSIAEVVTVAKEVMNIDAEPVWGSMDNRRWDTSIWVSDNRKAREQLDWQPEHTFAQGLAKTVEWTRNHPSDFSNTP